MSSKTLGPAYIRLGGGGGGNTYWLYRKRIIACHCLVVVNGLFLFSFNALMNNFIYKFYIRLI